jgi:16S rRNA (guanine527-N7)-methyltransferase
LSVLADEHDALVATARALGLVLSDRQFDRLQSYLALLGRWNKTFNLTAVRDPAGMLTQHVADCMAVLPPLATWRKGGRLLDVGSGGGLPGVVLAVGQPEWDVSCVDAVGKKAAFIRQVAVELPVPNLHALHDRVERLAGRMAFDVVACRAFASLLDFCSATRPLLLPGGVWLAMKGRTPAEEIQALPADIEVFHVEPLQVPGLQAHRCLVWMRPRAVG